VTTERNRKVMGKTIGEFILIVIGVLAALSAENWLSDRGDQELAQAYLDDLRDDLRSDSLTLEFWGVVVSAKITGLEALLGDLNATGPRVEAADLLLSLNYGAVVGTPQLAEATYRDLVGSGNLRLLSHQHRSAVVVYYTASSTFDRRLALYESQGKPPFTGLIPGSARPLGQDCAMLRDPVGCVTEIHEEFIDSMPQAELAALEAWRSRPNIREQLQQELGNALIAKRSFGNQVEALALARAELPN
jgi:hypothetical protein